jgi:hypothetical protein
MAGGDTGATHLATAIGTPVVALYGPGVEEFGFFPYRSRAVVLQRDLTCRPCSSHGGPKCPLGHHRCLVDIEPDEVARAAALGAQCYLSKFPGKLTISRLLDHASRFTGHDGDHLFDLPENLIRKKVGKDPL